MDLATEQAEGRGFNDKEGGAHAEGRRLASNRLRGGAWDTGRRRVTGYVCGSHSCCLHVHNGSRVYGERAVKEALCT